MKRPENEQLAERWLDETLARYSDAEPRDGFEGRLLANLQAHREERVASWRRLIWVPAGCAVVAALLVALLVLRPSAKDEYVPTPALAVSNPVPSGMPPVSSTNAPAKHSRRRATQPAVAKAPGPRKPQFPTPMPPTEQEQLLAAYVSATPTHELLAVAADQQQWRERVQKNAEADQQEPAASRDINHLQVSPLESGSTQAGAYGAR